MAKDPVKETLKNLQKRMGKSKAKLLSEGAASDILGVIPTGIDVLDHHVLGVGGLPVGRIIEVFSDEGVGKTSFLLHCMAKTQELGGVAAVAETEKKLESGRAAVFGCDLSQAILGEPDSIEEAMLWIQEILHSLPDSGPEDPPNFIAFDSLAASQTDKEFKEGMTGKDKIGHRAVTMSRAMRILPALAVKKRAHLFIVNQTRENIGVLFGDKKITPGGKALKFSSTGRLELFSGKAFKVGDESVGKRVTFVAKKLSMAVPHRKAVVRLQYDSGWDNGWSTIFHAKEQGAIPSAAKYNSKTLAVARKELGW